MCLNVHFLYKIVFPQRQTCALKKWEVNIEVIIFGMSKGTECPQKNGTQVNGYNFVTADSKYLKLCRHKVKILNDKHAKNQVNRTRRTCFTRYRISITIFAKRVLSASHRAGCTRPQKKTEPKLTAITL